MTAIGAPKYYKLIGKLPVPCTLYAWAHWFPTAERIVHLDHVGPLRVSTVFLGLDHSWGDGPPLLFETMIFDDNEDGYQTRCTTWDEAELMHEVAMAEARARYERALTALGKAARSDG
jgi:hypothetical protein